MPAVLRPLLLALALLSAALPAAAFQTSARAAIVIDHNTGTVLFEKNADEPLPPASMSKLMTIYLVFEALRDGRLHLDDRLPVSEHAMSYKGSSMFLTTRDRPTVEELILGVIVLSGNDAAAVLAEALSPDGTEAGFARLMTERARQLGMTASHFANSNGWPDPGQVMSVRDLATLATRLIRDFPEYYKWFAVREFAFDNRVPANRFNRNPLLRLDIGADGLKTGHTSEAGYGLVGSAVRGNRRVVFVLSGLGSERDRASEAERIVNWAFRQFVGKKILEGGTTVARLPVYLGRATQVAAVVPQDVTALVSAFQTGELKGELEVSVPLIAPIEKGQPVGRLVIARDELAPIEVPVVAGESVARGGLFTRLSAALDRLLGRQP